MKRRSILGSSLLLLLVAAAPAAAAGRSPVGENLSLFPGDQSWPASTAFHVRGGFALEGGNGQQANGKYEYRLEMDGADVAPTLRVTEQIGGSLAKRWYMEFAGGLTGVHTFVGHYYAPCGTNEFVPCGSLRPNTPVEILAVPATITFE